MGDDDDDDGGEDDGDDNKGDEFKLLNFLDENIKSLNVRRFLIGVKVDILTSPKIKKKNKNNINTIINLTHAQLFH